MAMVPGKLPSLERLREALSYDPETGLFRWRVTNSARAMKGALAGAILVSGYRGIRLDGKLYLAHRLAWLHAQGSEPQEQIDHLNREKADNRLCNLREATESQQCGNVGLSKRNTTGLKGVGRHRGRWRASLGRHGRTVHLGMFDTAEEAATAYCAAANAYFGEFSVPTPQPQPLGEASNV